MWRAVKKGRWNQKYILQYLVLNRHCSSVRGKILGLRREDSSVWERRAPISPACVKQLTKDGVKVLVQPSNRRAYPMPAYANAGAIIQEDISDAPVIIGVKQVPIDSLIPHKTYCFFSHTIKAQEANMALLDAILEKNIRLLDYEKMVDHKGQRVVAFGKWAGVAGMINILHGLGLRLLALGHHTPFMHIGPAHNYRNSGMARQAIRDAGYEISLGMLPKSIGPLTFVFTGSGNVSQGAQEMFHELPHEYVPPEMLWRVAEHGAMNKLYACSVSRADHLVRKEGGAFDPVEYDEHPERYYSNFSKKIAPYASVMVNGIYWAVNSPKLLTIPDAKYLLRPASTPWLSGSVGSPTLPHRLLAICDISADPGGSIEFMTECTTIDTPFCLYDADQHQNTESFAGPGVLVCSIDNMPTQLPLEATDFFGELLLPYIYEVLQSDATQPLSQEKFSPVIQGAIIASNGKLTPNFEYIQELRNARLKAGPTTSGKKVLVLGAGYVCAPAVEYLTRSSDVSITVVHFDEEFGLVPHDHLQGGGFTKQVSSLVSPFLVEVLNFPHNKASALKDEADNLAKKFDNTEPILLDVIERPDMLEDLIKSSDLVISLLPYSLHPKIAEQCIKHQTNMVTASYLTDQMRKLHGAAVDAGITIVNEVGLDPGIDHFLAMECFDDVHQNGGKIKSFISYCGGLPAPECSDNPLRYKFSWSPRGVLYNVLSSAKYLKDGKVLEIAPGTLMDHADAVDFLPGFNLEGFPNRDSTLYTNLYGIQEATTVLRGTLRFKGFCTALKGLSLLGMIDPNPHPSLHPKGPDISWKQFLCLQLGQHDHNIFVDNLKSLIFEKVGRRQSVLDAIENLGLLSDKPITKKESPLDTLSHYLTKRLCFEPGERDLVVLHHEIMIQWPDSKKECREIDLVCYGESDGYSAMAKTVGYPTGIAAKMVLDDEIQKKGMVVPMTPDIYMPVLKRLRQEGLTAVEKSRFIE